MLYRKGILWKKVNGNYKLFRKSFAGEGRHPSTQGPAEGDWRKVEPLSSGMDLLQKTHPKSGSFCSPKVKGGKETSSTGETDFFFQLKEIRKFRI